MNSVMSSSLMIVLSEDLLYDFDENEKDESADSCKKIIDFIVDIN